MGDSNNLGDLNVSITGDFSELQTAIDQSVSVAQDGSQQIASALQGVSDASGLAGRDLEIFQGLVEADTQAGIALDQSLQDIAGSAATVGDAIAGGAAAALESLQSAAAQADTSLGDIPPALDDVKSHSEEAAGGVEGLAESLLAVGEALAITEGLKEFVSEAIEVYGATQQLAITFQLLGASAAEAQAKIEELQQMSVTLGVPLENLEATARKLAVSFQDVEGVDLTDVLTSAANAAALTGRSFDTVATSLQRVELTGAVTSRQLIQLGVSWQQLADTMGVSITQAQELLKKGGQDAVTDLQAVLATIQRVSGDAAQAQAQGVTKQFDILKNQITIMFDDIGQIIAPVTLEVISALKTMATEATEAVNAFGQLPQPIQDIGIAVGGLAIAIPAAAAALGSLGLAVAGIEKLLPAVEEGLGAIGIETTGLGTAIAELALPVSAVFGGIAAWIATIKLEGITGDFEHLADVIASAEPGMVAVFNDVTSAAKALASEIPFVSGAMEQLSTYFSGTNWIKTFIDAATPAFQLLDIAIKEASIEITNAAAAFLVLTGHTQEAVQMLERLNGQTSTYTDEEKDATTTTDDYNEAVTQTVGAHVQLVSSLSNTSTNLTTAKKALDDAKASYDGTTGSIQNIEKAQLAYNQALKDAGQAATVAKNSIQDIAGALATANDAIYNAQQSVARLNQYLADGITELGGWDIATQLLPDALDRLAQATLRFQTATQGGKDSVTGFVNTVTDEIGKLGTLYNSWTQLNAIAGQTPAAAIAADNAFKQMASEAAKLGITLTNTGGVISASVTDPTKASAAAIQGLIDKFPGLNTAVDHTNDVLVNGQTVIAGAQAGFIKFGDDVADAAKQYTPFVGAVDDGTVASGDAVAALNSMANGVVNSSNAVADSTTKLEANTQAKKDNAAATAAADKAAQALAQHQSDINKAWASGDIVVQAYNSDVAHVVGTLNDATTATNKYDSEYQRLNSTMTAVLGYGTNVVGAFQTIDGQIQAIALHAADSAAAVQGLNDALKAAAASDAAWEAAGASGLNGLKTSLASVLSAEMAIAEAPSLGGALGGGGVSQGQIDQMAQALADATGQVVTTIDGAFVPAVTRAAEIAAAQSAAAAANTAATSSNTTAKTANTVATQATTTTLTDQQIAYENQFNSLLTNTSATVAATTSTAALATATASAAAGAASLGSALVDASTSAAVAAQVTTAAATAAVTALTTTFGTITGAAAGTTATPGSILAGAGNLGGISDYGPNSQGYTGGELNQSPPGGGVTLNVNVTGNSVTSQALVDQLANKVGSQIITNLRTVAGFKLG